jgi:16S rRNA (guanine527-N7)-methyltransferase
MNELLKYFPSLSAEQVSQYEALQGLYSDWNMKINVISRKDIDNLYEHHVLHSLAIACALHPVSGTRILDFGTGGGFPGIPLAIMWPECEFHLIDGTGKKIHVVEEVAKAIGLKNVRASHIRGEQERGKYDFVVSRAVMPLPDLVKIVRKNISATQRNAIGNGLLCLKGGDVSDETSAFRRIVEVEPVSTWFESEWFKGKHLIYLPL